MLECAWWAGLEMRRKHLVTERRAELNFVSGGREQKGPGVHPVCEGAISALQACSQAKQG